jgi:hypothetical protein
MKQDRIKLTGVVQKLIDRTLLNQPQQAQISLSGADYLYDELRVANEYQWEIGKSVEITIKASQKGISSPSQGG